MKMHIAIAATLILSLVSCGPRAGIVIDHSRLLEDRDSPLVTVMRRSQLLGSGVTHPLSLDNEVIAYLGAGDYVEFQILPGEHYIAIGREAVEEVIRFNAKSKGKYYFYFSLETGEKGPMFFRRLSPKDAESELSTNKYELLTAGK